MKVSYPRLRRARWRDGSTSDDAPKPRGEVVCMPGWTRMDINPDRVLAGERSGSGTLL